MNNISGNKLDKLVFGMFDQMVEGADKYVTEQGSTWLIFTESKKWVIEFTKDKTLWFNYNIFQGELELIGKDCIEDIDLIKNWFESRFLNKPKVDEIWDNSANMYFHIEDTIQNGVKHTMSSIDDWHRPVKDTIQNGVKDIDTLKGLPMEHVEYTIQNGVKHTQEWGEIEENLLEDTIQNGVKGTDFSLIDPIKSIEDTIQNGVKDTQMMALVRATTVEDTIQNGVKETRLLFERYHVDVEDTIENGEKIK